MSARRLLHSSAGLTLVEILIVGAIFTAMTGLLHFATVTTTHSLRRG